MSSMDLMKKKAAAKVPDTGNHFQQSLGSMAYYRDTVRYSSLHRINGSKLVV